MSSHHFSSAKPQYKLVTGLRGMSNVSLSWLLPRHTGCGSILLDATDRDSLSSVCGSRLSWIMRELVWTCSAVCSHATGILGFDGFIRGFVSVSRFHTWCNDALCHRTVAFFRIRMVSNLALFSQNYTLQTLWRKLS